MSEWNYSIVLVVPKEDQENGNQISELLGYGPNTFSLSAGKINANNEPEITHFYNHSYGAQSFVDIVTDLGNGVPPENMPVELLPTLSKMIISFRDGGDPSQHISEVFANNNLIKI